MQDAAESGLGTSAKIGATTLTKEKVKISHFHTPTVAPSFHLQQDHLLFPQDSDNHLKVSFQSFVYSQVCWGVCLGWRWQDSGFGPRWSQDHLHRVGAGPAPQLETSNRCPCSPTGRRLDPSGSSGGSGTSFWRSEATIAQQLDWYVADENNVGCQTLLESRLSWAPSWISVPGACRSQFVNTLYIRHQLLTPSGTGTSSWVPDGACIASSVSPLKQRQISSCVTYANLFNIKDFLFPLLSAEQNAHNRQKGITIVFVSRLLFMQKEVSPQTCTMSPNPSFPKAHLNDHTKDFKDTDGS